jgi:thiol-disulfide isomerase/thioredoxin
VSFLVAATLASLVLPKPGFATLTPGSPAPKLSTKKWIKGKPFTSFAAGRTYVIEFWATWCGPCLRTIPHVTALAKKRPDVTFLGVSIWEDNNNMQVENFAKKLGDKVQYSIAYGGNRDAMSRDWMDASLSTGIPTAFIVKDRRLMWIGHPAELEKPLTELKAGKFSLKVARDNYNRKLDIQRLEATAIRDLGEISKLYNEGKREEAMIKLRKLKVKYANADLPDFKLQLDSLEFAWLSCEEPAQWDRLTLHMARSGVKQDENRLLNFAMQYRAERLFAGPVAKACELVLSVATPEDVVTYYALATIHKAQKNYDRAIALLDLAIAAQAKSTYRNDSNFSEMLRTERAGVLKQKG